MSDATFDAAAGGLPDDLLERLFGTERLKRGWRVLIPANDDEGEEMHPAFINALFKRRGNW
ncbi:hypothetical protein KAJ83_18200 [Marivibrio halodurans]|uniref:Uncharacterized protein n=1 Tax=Marivibrio halodurans TaxID=2039722 RepID=A0A8J7V4D3_9PROT|nr:hypothetical protein [Marivibrio halodurans]MBP5858957.1 hypothetical protein [Marivibrio halodurans]